MRALGLPLLRVLCVLVLVGIASTGPAAAVPAELQVLPHPPIVVRADEDFDLPGSGVRSGSGRQDDPFVIADWEIDFGVERPTEKTVAGILLEGTTAYVVIEDMVLAAQSPRWQGSVLHGAQNVEVRNVRVEGLETGINVTDTSHVRIEGAHVSQVAQAGVVARRSQHVVVEAIKIDGVAAQGDYGTVGFGVLAEESSQLDIRNSTVQGAGIEGASRPLGSGIELRVTHDVHLAGNTLRANAFGVSFSSSSRIVFEDNLVVASVNSGLATAALFNSTIARNTIRGSGDVGLHLLGTDNTISFNEIHDNRGGGVYVGGSFNRLANNTVSGNDGWGLVLVPGAEGNIIADNSFEKNGEGDIRVFGRLGTNVLIDNEGSIDRSGTVWSPGLAWIWPLLAIATVAMRRRREERAP